MTAVAAAPGSTVITIQYNDRPTDDGIDTGLAWVIMHDNPVLAWMVDETGAAPARPVILGTMVTTGPDTGEVKSPPWAQRDGGSIFIPDMARGTTNEFFNFIAFNNGARRAIYAKFADTNLVVEFNQWASANPSLALKEPPNVDPADPPMMFMRSGAREA